MACRNDILSTANDIEAALLSELERESESGVSDFPDESDSEDDAPAEAMDNAETDQSVESDSEEDEESRVPRVIHGKNGHCWNTKAPTRRGRPLSDNIVIHIPGVKGGAKNIKTEQGAWNLWIDQSILEKLITFTNQNIQGTSLHGTGHTFTHLTNQDEVD